MNDELEKAAKAGARAGALGLLTGAATGDLRTALAGAVTSLLGEGFLTVFEAMESGNTERLALFATREDMARLTARVAKLESELAAEGLDPDRTDPVSQAQTASAFVRDVLASPTLTKREAVVNAAANQHDPRLGGAASRAYWYNVLRELPDVQVLVVRLMERHRNVAIFYEHLVVIGEPLGSDRRSASPFEIGSEDVATVNQVILQMAEAPAVRRLITPASVDPPSSIEWKDRFSGVSRKYVLTAGGRFLARLIAD